MRANGIAAIAAFLAVSAGADAAEMNGGMGTAADDFANVETIVLTDGGKAKVRPAPTTSATDTVNR